MYAKFRLEIQCSQCGLALRITQSVFDSSKHKRFYCNLKCMGKWRSEHCTGNAHHNFKPKEASVCVICGKVKHKYPSQAKLYKSTLCGSSACKGEFNRRHSIGKDSREKVPCAQCGCEVLRLPCHRALYERAFCNKRCRSLWLSDSSTGSANPNWNGGKSFEPYPVEWNNKLRESIRDRDGRQCRACGMSERDNKERLAVHHIDYNKQNLDPSNLAALCHNCHVRTNGNRSYWTEWFTGKLAA